MKKLDWYILGKFFKTFFFSIFLFTVISVVIDVGEKTDDFVRSGWTFSQIVFNYYIAFIPHIIALLFPLFVFISVIFFTSAMAGKSEIIAILASGTSYNRFLRPYWIGGILLALLLWFANRSVIPRAEYKRTYFETNYVNANSSYQALLKTSRNYYFRVDSFTYAGVHFYDTAYKSGGPFFMNRIVNNQETYNLRAANIRWDSTRHKWELQSVLERTIDGLHEHLVQSARKEVSFNFDPSEFERDEFTKDKLTTPELNAYIKKEQLRGAEGLNDLIVEKYRRDATSVTVLLLTLIGAVVASRKVRGGSGSHLAVGFVTAAAFIITDRFSTIFSTKGSLPPMLAAWIPNIFFALVAFYFYRRTPK